MTNELPNRAKLYQKIAKVTAEMSRVPKNGNNTFHHYKYVTESDLTDAIRELLYKNGLAFLPPTVLSHERLAVETKGGPLTRVQMRFTLACCETGETVESVLWADGQDGADKGFYKAYTGGVKYFLMKTFLVSTGDDPEDDSQQRQPERRQEPRQLSQHVSRDTGELFEGGMSEKDYTTTVQTVKDLVGKINALGGQGTAIKYSKPIKSMTYDEAAAYVDSLKEQQCKLLMPVETPTSALEQEEDAL